MSRLSGVIRGTEYLYSLEELPVRANALSRDQSKYELEMRMLRLRGRVRRLSYLQDTGVRPLRREVEEVESAKTGEMR